jgi:tetrahydromethanopterin S-methyltransferase subunit F
MAPLQDRRTRLVRIVAVIVVIGLAVGFVAAIVTTSSPGP